MRIRIGKWEISWPLHAERARAGTSAGEPVQCDPLRRPASRWGLQGETTVFERQDVVFAAAAIDVPSLGARPKLNLPVAVGAADHEDLGGTESVFRLAEPEVGPGSIGTFEAIPHLDIVGNRHIEPAVRASDRPLHRSHLTRAAGHAQSSRGRSRGRPPRRSRSPVSPGHLPYGPGVPPCTGDSRRRPSPRRRPPYPEGTPSPPGNPLSPANRIPSPVSPSPDLASPICSPCASAYRTRTPTGRSPLSTFTPNGTPSPIL